jgi:inner membrane protein
LASLVTHSVCALALGTAFRTRAVPARFWLLGLACTAAPDLDVIGFAFGIPYEAPFGHRGATHSLACAAALAAVVTWLAFRRSSPDGLGRGRAFAFLFTASASHGLLDALTNGGLGVAFFWPFSAARYFLPWRPIEVSPIGVRALLGARGLAVLESELLWLWLPSALLAALCLVLRRRRD